MWAESKGHAHALARAHESASLSVSAQRTVRTDFRPYHWCAASVPMPAGRQAPPMGVNTPYACVPVHLLVLQPVLLFSCVLIDTTALVRVNTIILSASPTLVHCFGVSHTQSWVCPVHTCVSHAVSRAELRTNRRHAHEGPHTQTQTVFHHRVGLYYYHT